MAAAAAGNSNLGIPQNVGKEFLKADKRAAKDEASLAANAAIPAGLRRKTAFDASGITKHAAGVLFVAPDGDILLLRRTGTPGQDSYVGHWSLPGGGVEEGETPEVGAAREAKEEMGVDTDPKSFKVLDQKITPTGMAFHTFAQPVEKKFWPQLNDEHNGAGWFPLSELPRPIHPAVEAMLKDKLGDDLAGARDGLVSWSKAAPEPDGATDSAFVIAMDRDSVREKTRDGRLIVKKTHISKANVCPYRGQEIPGWEKLGLEPDRVYNLLRDPEELKKAAPTLNGVQLLIKHIPVNAEDHRPNETVGSLGDQAEFDGEYLDNSLYVNAQHAIDAIETGKQRELSAGYHYEPDMTPGNFGGTAYDGVMRNIVFNHVALVEDGRAGPDVVVGDEALRENDMAAKATRFGAVALSITAAHVAPLLAMDQKATLPVDLFKGLTSKNYKTGRENLLAGVRLALDGKLRKGLALDGSMQNFAKAIDAFNENMSGAGVDEEAPKPEEMENAAKVGPLDVPEPRKEPGEKGFDAEPFKNFLREKGLGEDDIMKACDMMPKSDITGDAEETPEEKAAREKKEKDAAAAKDAEMKDMVSKPAMDAALKAQASEFQKELAKVRDNERGVRAAIAEVHPWVGELPATMAFDTAADVHRHALVMRGVEGAKTLHADALLPILKTLPKNGARPSENQTTNPNPMAMDASAVGKARAMAPGLEGISTTL
jgi:ADP-ribose pyrophosphatase YjhB (NUDIX family)